MFSNDRDAMRRVWTDAWRKAQTGGALEPLEQQLVAVIRAHPEYHALLEGGERTMGRDFPPEARETNPFLHLGLHLAILEQLATDRPLGMRAIYQRIAESAGDAHRAEHRIMECLAQSLWEAQRDGSAPDQPGYLACLWRLAGRPEPRG